MQLVAGATGRQAEIELVPVQFTGAVQLQVDVPLAVIFVGSSVKSMVLTVKLVHPEYCTGPIALKLTSVPLIVPVAVAVALKTGALALKELLP
jgi:hypothetical protein